MPKLQAVLKAFALLGLLALPPLLARPMAAAAAPSNSGTTLSPNETGISGASLTANPNMLLRVSGVTTATVYAVVTRSAATALNMVCTGGPSPTVQAGLGVASAAANGNITMATSNWSYPVSASGTFRMLVAPLYDTWLVCTFSGASAGAGDQLSVWAKLGGAP